MQKGLPMHGLNQWPSEEDFPEFKPTVLKYLDELTELGHLIMSYVIQNIMYLIEFLNMENWQLTLEQLVKVWDWVKHFSEKNSLLNHSFLSVYSIVS